MRTQLEFAERFIWRWEDGKSDDPVRTHSMDPEDSGNWTSGKIGVGALVGSQHGVTPAVLAAHRRVLVSAITKDVMRALSRREAAEIAIDRFLKGPNLHRLAWCPATASLFDMGWGTGPLQAIKLAQRMVDAPIDDGVLTPMGETERRWNALMVRQSYEFTAGAFWAVRDAFYDLIIAQNPVKKKYSKGWDNRSDYFTPAGTEGEGPEFWKWFMS